MAINVYNLFLESLPTDVHFYRVYIIYFRRSGNDLMKRDR